MFPAGARLSGHLGDLVDVSLTGALVALDTDVPLGSRHVLQILVGANVMELDARVARVKALSHHHTWRWHVGLTFVDLTPEVRRTIPAMLAKLAALGLRPRRTRGSGA